jgi:hypothetical protein
MSDCPLTVDLKGREAAAMPEVQDLTLSELNERRRGILERLGMTYQELAEKAAARSLVGDEWAAWEELREIDFLRNG